MHFAGPACYMCNKKWLNLGQIKSKSKTLNCEKGVM